MCPVNECDHHGFCIQGGCRKHVFTRYGWFNFFNVKPNTTDILPVIVTYNTKNSIQKRSNMALLPSSLKECTFAVNFVKWLGLYCGVTKNSTQICDKNVSVKSG